MFLGEVLGNNQEWGLREVRELWVLTEETPKVEKGREVEG